MKKNIFLWIFNISLIISFILVCDIKCAFFSATDMINESNPDPLREFKLQVPNQFYQDEILKRLFFLFGTPDDSIHLLKAQALGLKNALPFALALFQKQKHTLFSEQSKLTSSVINQIESSILDLLTKNNDELASIILNLYLMISQFREYETMVHFGCYYEDDEDNIDPSTTNWSKGLEKVTNFEFQNRVTKKFIYIKNTTLHIAILEKILHSLSKILA